ncbi:nudC domain-containing protein 3-like [Ostrea edulis]|uniref:nudC domain-containing protein 3-like n=1 Tax=Ostrea edulis TaxID=37623 RepID=UPI0024AF192D|nr:nudC domain-containing protein 3-like [Ostrea edulis]
MSKNLEAYDSALLGIIQHEGEILKFLDVVLGFLYRRTDFYRVMKSRDDKLGFPPGVAAKMLLNMFKKYDDLTRKDDEEREKIMQKKQHQEYAVPPPAKIVEISLETNTTLSTTESPKRQCNVNGNPTPVETNEESKPQQMSATSTRDKEPDPNNPPPSKRQDDEDDPELAAKQKVFQANPESYNGAVRDNYSWSQSITDVDIRIQIPNYIVKGRDVKVDIEKKRVKVSHKTDSGSWTEIVNGDLPWEINKEESMWTLVPKEHVHINLEKREERWWEAVLTTEEKISVRKIDASRPMTDLDDEAQAKIEEMMYNEQQKRMGKPTSQEQKVQHILRDAWNAEGSPFKGQPFDPTKINMDQGGVVTINNQEEPMKL